jgi:hypothetical protein
MKRKFTEEEVKELIYGWDVETITGEDRRWSRIDTVIVELDNKFYKLWYDRGLTESQEDTFEAQEADEVVQVEETVVVKKWVPVPTCG